MIGMKMTKSDTTWGQQISDEKSDDSLRTRSTRGGTEITGD